jgi:hypothetical protein
VSIGFGHWSWWWRGLGEEGASEKGMDMRGGGRREGREGNGFWEGGFCCGIGR